MKEKADEEKEVRKEEEGNERGSVGKTRRRRRM